MSKPRTLLLLLVAFGFTNAAADDYLEARAELVTAYQAQDYPAMVLAAERALGARPGFPGALFNLAMAQSLNGEPERSLQTLEQILAGNVDFGADEMDVFAPLHELDDWDSYVARVKALYEPVGTAGEMKMIEEGDFIPEGIAVDAKGRVYVGSIRKGKILRHDSTFRIISDGTGHWSVFGMRFHPDGTLWFASSAVAQLENVGDAQGQAGLFQIDVDSGELLKSAILPEYADNQVLGDLVIADANTIYTTDSITGGVYRYNIDANEYEILVAPGKLNSPQGLVLDQSGGFLYIADYTGGLYRASLIDRSLAKVRVADSVVDYGIDGLYRHGDELIVIQNGIRPHRVAALKLSEDGMAVTGSRVLASNLPDFDEPTLGAIRGDKLLFVANSHWNRFDAENRLPEGLAGPIVLKLDLSD